MNIAHLTSAHPRDDIRIFHKQCRSLVQAAHQVTLIVADGHGNEIRDGVHIVDAGAKPSGRLARITSTVRQVYRCALSLQPDIIHFHDPELILAALYLKKAGIRVIYDVHEDVPRQILAKYWIPRWLRPVTSYCLEKLENRAAQHFDAIVTATPLLRQRFALQNANVIDVCNYPSLPEQISHTDWLQRRNEVCYIGSISRTRGIWQIVAALLDTEVRLNLAGRWSEPDLRAQLVQEPGWARVNDLGILGRAELNQTLARSKIGLVTLLPTPSYVNALPIKLFEYMAAGLPVIASDFPLWRRIVNEAGCGLLVDPADPVAIATAIRDLLQNETLAAQMGQAGQRAVQQHYRWEFEANKLIRLYQYLHRERHINVSL